MSGDGDDSAPPPDSGCLIAEMDLLELDMLALVPIQTPCLGEEHSQQDRMPMAAVGVVVVG